MNKLFQGMFNKKIFICGSTGVGKTKLSIELAQKFNGEILNMDSMQMNKDLDIALNKASTHETDTIKHHMLSFLSIEEGVTYDVHKYRMDSDQTLKQIEEQRKLPFIVGGTTYYMEALIYKDFLSDSIERKIKDVITHLPHPNQLRKIRKENNMLNISKPKDLRYPDSIIIWMDFEDRDLLKKVLSDRIDLMIERGLVKELQDFIYKCATKIDKLYIRIDETPKDIYTLLLEKDETCEMQRRGILQCIGLKEFLEYLRLDQETRETKEGKKVFESCKERLLTSTYRYAIRQKRWMINRFLKRDHVGSLPIFRICVDPIFRVMIEEKHMLNFDETLAKSWSENVSTKSEQLVDHFLSNNQIDFSQLELKQEKLIGESPITDKDLEYGEPPYVCSKCNDKMFFDLISYKSHLQSNKHKKRKCQVLLNPSDNPDRVAFNKKIC